MTNPYSLKATKMNSAFDPGRFMLRKLKGLNTVLLLTTLLPVE